MAFNCVIVGGGPAGLAPLVSASRSGMLANILADGLAVVERGPAIGAGVIGGYAINSDSAAETIVSCVLDNTHPALAGLCDHAATRAVAAYGRGAAPLRLVGAFLAVVGGALRETVAATPGSAVLVGHDALETRQTADGLWSTRVRRVSDGATRTILSRLVVLATGGHQPDSRLGSLHVAGLPFMPRHAGKLMQSNEVLTADGLASIGRRLAAGSRQRIAIVGGCSSALACARALLHTGYGRRLGADAVTVLHRRPLRVFYSSAAAAIADGYDRFGPDDICPVSGFVFRFAGFRLESRELVMSALGIGGRKAERRLRLHLLATGYDAAALAILDDADVVIVAMGYRPRALTVLDISGRAIQLQAAGPGAPPLVDGECRVLGATGTPVPGLLGIGLAAGFVSPALIGGEPSFSGQTNSLWQWQNDIGAVIARRILQSTRIGHGTGPRTGEMAAARG